MLVVAYALEQYFQDGHELNDTGYEEGACMDKFTRPWQSGELLLKYLTNVGRKEGHD